MYDGVVGSPASGASSPDGKRSSGPATLCIGSVQPTPIVSPPGYDGTSSSNLGGLVAVSCPVIGSAAGGSSAPSPYSDPAIEGGNGILSSSGSSATLSSASADDDGEPHSLDSKKTGTMVEAKAF